MERKLRRSFATMRAYIGLGSNLGDRLNNIRIAIDKISHLDGVKSLRLSSIYETEPVQCEGGWFYNAVLEVEINMEPVFLMRELLQIENSMGRVNPVRSPLSRCHVGTAAAPPGRITSNGVNLKMKGCERSVDLDLLLFEDRIIDDPSLTLPHS